MTERLLVAAIDFGTTYSGWAFSFRHDFEADPTKIQAKQWSGGHHVSLKAPTTVLIKPDGKTLEAFGYEAEDKYAKLADDNKHRTHYYFKLFKMMLYGKIGLTRDIMLEDDKDQKLPALTVFSLAIGHLRQDLLKTCNDRLKKNKLTDGDIHWVLTVPAIWNDAAKQFMREAAQKAGIASDNLSIALEPEAASLFCRHLPIQQFSGNCGKSLKTFDVGSKYMVLDAGGGTVDITVHEVLPDGKLKELHKASGGDWGGTMIDNAFRQMLIKIFSLPVLRKFQLDHTDDYLDLLREFEIKKRDIKPASDTKITLKIPSALAEVFEKETEEGIQDAIDQSPYAGKIKFTGDKMRADVSVYKHLFDDALEGIIEHISGLVRDPVTRGTTSILMVGGFSESPLLQTAIKNTFPKMTVIIPEEAGLVVLKGAVVFGHGPNAIAKRVCKHTYGIELNTLFDDKEHDVSKRFESNGRCFCKEIFDKHVEIGQCIKYGEPQSERTYAPLTNTQDSVDIVVYASDEASPKYVSDKGCQQIGKVTVDVRDMSVPLSQRTLDVTLTFSGTEIEVIAKEKHTGKITKSKANFLG
ncbi:heat shock 70 kDa protein 12A-like [Mya arenaria]|uniref:heat shock 70 kDa protein 12A-like n=1 Tax=Mya arenaria TaxID=6604 RepID=UPI0022E350E5|nr:heat shock 70 kDa protein 12A-like [Mya arenaria]XP_052794099.1 heat shock 70 kDa protein 12A-like [Mya arenaria]XP_052794100.1 heat shock 70 kDa protein 12A-like [Mya arenaria]